MNCRNQLLDLGHFSPQTCRTVQDTAVTQHTAADEIGLNENKAKQLAHYSQVYISWVDDNLSI